MIIGSLIRTGESEVFVPGPEELWSMSPEDQDLFRRELQEHEQTVEALDQLGPAPGSARGGGGYS